MPLSAGTRLGPFEILAPLGEGGMGEVYRATDTRLNRDVALKVLPDAFAHDSDRLARFAREAQVVAALNHPNIAALYGVEDTGGRPTLVLELVEGSTLAERLAIGPVSLEESLPIARQIADALEAAHEQGVVHRDLKPANIKLRPDGIVKVLDFGLARLTEASGSSPHNPSMSPTITSPAMTGMGVILGTAAYMAPEQAAGKVADKRADIWAFGVVLWEMLAGERLFGSGESTSHVLADVLRAPIDFAKIPAGPVRDLLQRCLDRDAKTRLRDIGEARVMLSRPMTAPVLPTAGASTRQQSLAWVAAVALLAASTGLAIWAPWRAEPERPVVRLTDDLGADVALPSSASASNVALSPDGRRLAYLAAVAGGPTRLYVRPLDSDEAVELPGSDNAHAVTFSQDSASVAFLSGNFVYRMSADGGAPQRLAETDSNVSVTWGDNDTILVSGWSGLRRIPAAGGAAIKLTETDNNNVHVQAHVLPGARHVLFMTGSVGSDVTAIEAIPVAGGTRKVIVNNAGAPYYLRSGHLLYLRQGTLFAVRFDPETLAPLGEAVPMVTDVKTTQQGLVAAGTFSIGGDGTLVYRRSTGSTPVIGTPRIGPQGTPITPGIVEWIDSSGKRSPLVPTAGVYTAPRLLPDGSRLLLTALSTSRGGTVDVFAYEPRRETMTPLTVDGQSAGAVWTPPDGRFVVFIKLPRGGASGGDLQWFSASGGTSQTLLSDVGASSVGSFTADGKRLAYMVSTGSRGRTVQRSIFTVTVTDERGQLKASTPARFSSPEANEFSPEFSPDGRWIAFVTPRSGQNEVWVRAAPVEASPEARGQRYEIQISNNGGTNPRWLGPNELLYQSADQLMSVRYAVVGEKLIPERARVRIEKLGGTQWDVMRDGRVAVVTPVKAAKPPVPDHTVVFVQNFADEVRRRVK